MDIIQQTKICKTCLVTKPLSDFTIEKRSKDGVTNLCKICSKERSKIYYKNNSIEFKKKSKLYRKLNHQKLLERNRLYYKTNRESNIQKSKEFKLKNPDYMKTYRSENASHINATRRIYKKTKFKNDPNYKLIEYYRSRVRLAVMNNQKAGTTLDLIGCNIDELKLHLESKFVEGMSWDNYGRYGWHIDHIIPCSFFDFSDPTEQRICFHYTNLQPLWADENINKSDKLGYYPVNLS